MYYRNDTHFSTTVGGRAGHYLRRSIHVATALIPLGYYHYRSTLESWLGMSASLLVAIIVIAVLLLEGLRLILGWTVFGQRDYEARQLSAFAWGVVAIGLVLLLAPSKAIAIPIIFSCAFIDPIAGELRRSCLNRIAVIVILILLVILLWYGCYLWLQTPLWLAFLMGPVIVAAEWPTLSWIDDNALMQLVPLALIWLLCWLFN